MYSGSDVFHLEHIVGHFEDYHMKILAANSLTFVAGPILERRNPLLCSDFVRSRGRAEIAIYYFHTFVAFAGELGVDVGVLFIVRYLLGSYRTRIRMMAYYF